MRIIILSSFPPLRGGISQFNASLCKALEEEGHELLALGFSVQYPSILFPGKRQDVDRVNSEHQIHVERTLHSFQPHTWRRTAKRIDDFEADLLIVPFWVSVLAPSLTGVLKRIKSSPKVIGLIHNAIPHESKFYDAPLFQRFAARLNAAVVLSAAVKKQVEAMNPQLQILELRHPIYGHFGKSLNPEEIVSLKSRYHLDPDKTCLLFFGLIREYKGLEVLLDAFELLPATFQLLIVGEVYGDVKPLNERLEAHPKKADIHFENRFVEDDEVAGIFSMADYVLLPYLRASQSGVTAVAIHFEKPIIASNVGGLSEFIHQGKTGLLVESSSAQSLVEAIEQAHLLAPKEEDWQQLKDDFSWGNFAKKLCSLVKS